MFNRFGVAEALRLLSLSLSLVSVEQPAKRGGQVYPKQPDKAQGET
jgi:hypothetical protein